MTALMKRVIVSDPYERSGRQVRGFLSGRRILLRALRAIARAGAATLIDACGVELAAHHRILHADVLDPAATKQDHRVLLQVVALAGDVGGDLHAVGEAYARNLAYSRVRLPWGLGGHLGADPALEGRRVEGGTIRERVKTARQSDDLRLAPLVAAALLAQLVDGGHLDMKARESGIERLYIRAPNCATTERFSYPSPWQAPQYSPISAGAWRHPFCSLVPEYQPVLQVFRRQSAFYSPALRRAQNLRSFW